MANYGGAPAVSYLRVSTDDQQNSMDMQTTQLQNYAKYKGLSLPSDLIFQDPDTSGTIIIQERDGGSNAFQCLRDGKAKHLVIHKLDRLGRNAVDIQTAYHVLTKEMGVTVHFLDLGGDSLSSDSPISKFVVGMMSLFAELEVANIRNRINGTFDEKFRKTEQIGAIPFGWKAVPTNRINKQGNALNLIVPDESEMEWLNKILTWRFVEKRNLQSICDELNREGVKTKKNGKIGWTKGNLSKLLKSRHVKSLLKSNTSQPIGIK